MTQLYAVLAALGLACLASTALLQRRPRVARSPEEFDGYGWS